MTRDQIIRLGFIAGGIANIVGVLIATLFFTNDRVAAHYPEVFSDFGILAIILWGLAYIAVSSHWRAVPWLVAVFAVEKLAYVVTYVLWMTGETPTLASLYEESFVTGMFYTVYGINDFVFMVFFAWALWEALQARRALPA